MQLTAEELLTSIWAALRRIEDNLALPPAPLEPPYVHVDAPDLTDVVEAVNQLKPGVNADDIARALAAVLAPQSAQPVELAGMAEFQAAVKELSWRLKGVGAQAYGGGAVSMAPGQTIGIIGDVEITNDSGNPIPVRQFASTTATTSRVPSSATTVDLLAMKPTRNQASVYNESTAVLYIKFGTGASATDYTLPIAGGGYYELPVRYTGVVTGLWATANGFAQMTEF